MPRDDWQKARDQDTGREASAEFLEFGEYRSFESVYSDLTPERNEPEVTESWDLVNWLNDLRSPCLKATRSYFSRIEGPLSEKHADIVPLLVFALRDPDNISGVVEAVRQIGEAAKEPLQAAFDIGPVGKKLGLVRKHAAIVLCQLGWVDFSRTRPSMLLELSKVDDVYRSPSFRKHVRTRKSDLLPVIEDRINQSKSGVVAAFRLLLLMPDWKRGLEPRIRELARSSPHEHLRDAAWAVLDQD